MKKQILFFAVAALALASCSSENDVVQSPDVQQTAADDGAVGFDVYTQRTTTRAGWHDGAVTTAGLKETDPGKLGESGFGVFGYYTNSATYDQQAIPNFFYNQQVKYNGTYFAYEPIKYWPNEYGQNAFSEENDKVSFFAYAPYVLVNPSTGKAVNANDDTFDQTASAELQKWGITSLSRNSATGDPIVKYIATFDQAKAVDLCWGVCDQTTWPIVNDATPQYINDGNTGLPWLDVLRPAEAKTQADAVQRVKFTFKHATSQLKVLIDAFVDGVNNANTIADKTKVYVRSITFEGFAMKGSLNLNNSEAGPNKAYWLDYAGTNDLVTGESVTIYDGRKDGKEGTPSGVATNEKSLGLNPNLIQSTVWGDAAETKGVTNEEQFLFCNGSSAATGPIYVIPTGDEVKVTIVYDIETADENLATYVSDATQHGSSIENCITKTISFGSDTGMENGKAYTIKLHLGMNSVKFDADVTPWEETAGREADLPANVPVFAAVSGTPAITNVTVPYNATSYTFGISGLNGGETVTADPASPSAPLSSPTTNAANASGYAIETVTITPNTKVTNETSDAITWSGKASGKGVKLTITQLAAPLGLKSKSITESTIVLDWNTDAAETADIDASDATRFIVEKNGTKLTNGTTPAANEFTWDFTNKKITLGEDMKAGDVFTITIQAGDATAETITVKVGGISFASAGPIIVPEDETDTNTLIQTGTGTVEYESSETGTAEVDANTGVVTGKGYNSGTAATITATVTDDATNGWYYLTKTATYTVKSKDLATITIDAGVNIKVGQYVNRAATVTPGAAGTPTYKSADESIATVDSDGKITGVKVGTTTITATAVDTEQYFFKKKTATINVTVTPATP